MIAIRSINLPNITIRRAEREDSDTVFGLISSLADYEKLEPPTDEARARLLHDGWPTHGETPKFAAWLAEIRPSVEDDLNGSVTAVGYAITFETYSTFLARPTLYLEDIFVLPEYRGHSVGTTLMNHLIAEAKAHGCGRMEWVVLDWNTTAQQFYRKFNAVHLTEWLTYRITLG